MPRGGARQGQPGKSYANRSDLNVDRAPQPGASGNLPEDVSAGGNPAPGGLTPDMIPTLEEPTQFPDQPVTAGLPFGDGTDTLSVPAEDLSNTLINAALRRHPDNPDLQRLVTYMNLRANA